MIVSYLMPDFMVANASWSLTDQVAVAPWRQIKVNGELPHSSGAVKMASEKDPSRGSPARWFRCEPEYRVHCCAGQ